MEIKFISKKILGDNFDWSESHNYLFLDLLFLSI